MAATIAVLGSAFTTTAGNKTVTATPTNGDLIVVVAVATGVASTIADNGTGGTYTQVDSTRTGFSTTGNLQMFVRDNLVTGAGSTIYTATQTSSTGGGLVVLRVTGMTLTGASAVRSSGGQSTVAAGTPAPVLSLTPLSSNPIITAMANSTSTSTTNVVQRTGYTEDFDNGYNTPPTGLEVSHLASGETSATLTYGGATGSQFASIAIELAYVVAPTVTTSAASSILGTTATGNGNVTSAGNGTISSRGFCWSTSANPTTADSKVVDGSATTGAYSDSMTGLTIATGYHYRAYAINEAGTSYGADTTFTTNTSPTTALNTPVDTATGVSTTPTLNFTGTDVDGDTEEYEFQLDTVNTFNSVIDSYSEVNQNTTIAGISSARPAVGQSFLGNGRTILSAAFYLLKASSPTGNAVAKIYAMSGTYGTGDNIPTGAALATSDNFDVSTLTTSFQLKTLTFSGVNQITLTNGANYVVTFEYSGAVGSITAGVGSVVVHQGNTSYFQGGVWNTAAADTCFYVKATILVDKLSTADAGFTAGHPFASGVAKDFTVQVGDTLAANTLYYWRVRAIDPSGTNTYGAYATTRSFTTAALSNIPNKIYSILQAVGRGSTY